LFIVQEVDDKGETKTAETFTGDNKKGDNLKTAFYTKWRLIGFGYNQE